MQFCPRCGSSNQDGRAACWKCFGQLRKPDSKKAQHITLTDKDTPAAEPAIDAPAVLPIPELAETEPDVPTPAFALDTPFAEASPEVAAPAVEAEPAPQVASFGDVMIPSPSFDSDDEATSEDEEDIPSKPVPILGLVNLPEDEQEEPETLDLDGPATVPIFAIDGPSDEPLVAGTSAGAQSADGTSEPGLPWWLTQDDSEDTSAGVNGSTIDLDDSGGLEFISLDDDDTDSKKSPPNA